MGTSTSYHRRLRLNHYCACSNLQSDQSRSVNSATVVDKPVSLPAIAAFSKVVLGHIFNLQLKKRQSASNRIV